MPAPLGWTEIPALPITAAKAADLFLNYEAKHEKVCLPCPSSLLWLPSTEQGETEKGGAQVVIFGVLVHL